MASKIPIKKYFYIFCFTVFGILVGFLLHAWLEIWYIKLLLANFNRYGFGLTWEDWFLIHKIYSIVTFLGFAILGFWAGTYWWVQLYVLKKYKWQKKWN